MIKVMKREPTYIQGGRKSIASSCEHSCLVFVPLKRVPVLIFCLLCRCKSLQVFRESIWKGGAQNIDKQISCVFFSHPQLEPGLVYRRVLQTQTTPLRCIKMRTTLLWSSV